MLHHRRPVPLLPLLPLLLLSTLLGCSIRTSFAKPAPEPAPLFGFGIGRTQSSGVEGILLCQGKPAANVLVKLYDDDRGIDTDDLMVGGHGRVGREQPVQKITFYPFFNFLVSPSISQLKLRFSKAEGKTDEEGHFKLEGFTQEITDIDPKVNIYHDCNDFKPCQRKISIMVSWGIRHCH